MLKKAPLIEPQRPDPSPRWRSMWRSDCWSSLEERYKDLKATMDARHDASAVRHLLGDRAALPAFGWEDVRKDLVRAVYTESFEWEQVEKVSSPFFMWLGPRRKMLEAKLTALLDALEERNRYLPKHKQFAGVGAENSEVMATYRELKALPEGDFIPRPEKMSEHALALYEFLVQRDLPDRQRGRKWQSPQLYNETTMRIVQHIIEHYYGVSDLNIKSRLQAARRARARRP